MRYSLSHQRITNNQSLITGIKNARIRLRTAGAAVPPQFVFHLKRTQKVKNALCGRPPSACALTGSPVLFYWTAFTVFLQQSTCATSAGVCWGGFQPWSRCAALLDQWPPSLSTCRLLTTHSGYVDYTILLEASQAHFCAVNQISIRGCLAPGSKSWSRMTHPWMTKWYRDCHRSRIRL